MPCDLEGLEVHLAAHSDNYGLMIVLVWMKEPIVRAAFLRHLGDGWARGSESIVAALKETCLEVNGWRETGYDTYQRHQTQLQQLSRSGEARVTGLASFCRKVGLTKVYRDRHQGGSLGPISV